METPKQFHKKPTQPAMESTTLPPVESPEESIPRSFVGYNRDDDRSRYLGLRASGFTIREALGLVGKAKSTLSLWRHEQTFLDYENNIPELRKTLALEYAGLEFLRNYRLILEKDFRVLKGSLTRKVTLGDDGKSSVAQQDSQDFQYLLKLRAHYTPQQLQSIEQMFGKGDNKEDFNWMEHVMEYSRTETVKVGTVQRQESNLAPIDAKVVGED